MEKVVRRCAKKREIEKNSATTTTETNCMNSLCWNCTKYERDFGVAVTVESVESVDGMVDTPYHKYACVLCSANFDFFFLYHIFDMNVAPQIAFRWADRVSEMQLSISVCAVKYCGLVPTNRILCHLYRRIHLRERIRVRRIDRIDKYRMQRKRHTDSPLSEFSIFAMQCLLCEL